MSREVHRRSLFFPLLLIVLGALFLVDRLGGMPIDVGEILTHWWPVLLIALGVDLVFSRRTVGHWIAGILTVAFLAAVGWAFFQFGGDWGTVSEPIVQALDGAQGAQVTIACNAALDLEGGVGHDTLIAGTVDLGRWETLVHTYRLEGGVARLTLEERRGAIFPQWKRGWSLRLNSDVPLLLDVSCGVGHGDLDLSDLVLGELVLTSGRGGASVALPAVDGLQAQLQGGRGAVSVTIPRDTGVRVRVVQEDGDLALPSGYTRSGDAYSSPNYDSAAKHLELKIEVGSGGMTIKTGSSAGEEGTGRTI